MPHNAISLLVSQLESIMKVGYARVSTKEQSLDAQVAALVAAGCEEVHREKLSGKSADTRPQLRAAIKFVRKGDALVVTKLDRLARSILDLNEIAQELHSKGANLIVLDQAGIDTTTATGKLVFDVLGSVAEFERKLIAERVTAGRTRAIAKGVKFGAPAKLTEQQVAKLKRDMKKGGEPVHSIAARHGVSRATAYRLTRDAEA